MMKTTNRLLFLLSFLLLLACEKSNEPIINDSDLVIGNWINPIVVDTIWKYERADSLKNDGYGFSIQTGQLFVERKNAGWCGTPPISYANFDGTWAKEDSTINISVAYWGGMADYQWKIISVDNNNLMIYRVNEEYHNEEW
ncbi:MAG: hypothetical protein K9H64_13670 [Bacteroidales bacterium]|nr:hypothetical protein [Bacteroidales bacterium]MCF8457062.1 hypothetical protein [Bacteroidales bacterium]